MNASVYTGSPGLFGHPLILRCHLLCGDCCVLPSFSSGREEGNFVSERSLTREAARTDELSFLVLVTRVLSRPAMRTPAVSTRPACSSRSGLPQRFAPSHPRRLALHHPGAHVSRDASLAGQCPGLPCGPGSHHTFRLRCGADRAHPLLARRDTSRTLLQDLRAATVHALHDDIPGLGEVGSFDVTHFSAWVQAHNERASVKERSDHPTAHGCS